MLGIARHTDYAARLVLHLSAAGDDAQATMREIAAERRLPLPFVRRLVGRLIRAGILATVRGAGGGIRLARPAAEISLLQVIEAMEGTVALNRCVNGGAGCPLASSCPIQCVWNSVNEQVKQNLSAARFDSLARSPHHVAAHVRQRSSRARCSPRRP